MSAKPTDARARFVTSEVARALVVRVARVAAGAGSPLMPLKGALLQRWVYPDPSERLLTDVDLLVPPGQFEAVTTALLADGFQLTREEPGGRERALRHPGLPLDVDLHQSVFPAGQFRLPTEALFARSAPDDDLFGVRIARPAPEDLYAHLVGHLALSWLYLHRFANAGDLAATATALKLEPRSIARHLEACGLATAARYALPLAQQASPDPFAEEVLAALRRDPLRAAAAKAILRIVPKLPKKRGLGLLPPVVLHRAPREIARIFTRAARSRWTRR